jgi:hypothetical protein
MSPLKYSALHGTQLAAFSRKIKTVMSKHSQQEQPDRHLEAPAEANRDKHINFLEIEEERTGRDKSPGRTSKNDHSEKNRTNKDKPKRT